MMNLAWPLLLTSQLLCLTSTETFRAGNETLSRRRRYLVFPEGANFVVRFALNSALIGVTNPSNWFHIIELDLSYKLPNAPKFLRRVPYPFFYHRRNRRDVYDEMKTLFNMHGEDGEACLLRAFCEARHVLSAVKNKSLVEEILELIFTIPPGSDDVFSNQAYHHTNLTDNQDCGPWTRLCGVSLLDFLVAAQPSHSPADT